jgi:hypothetical protein
MSAIHTVLGWLRVRPWVVYSLLFLLLLVVHVIIFRDVLAAIPQILQGNSVVVREELVPFFSFSSQFWPESTSSLTSSEEVRVVYSFWTSWVRHYAVLPFALVLLNTISAFVLFYAFYRIGRFFAGRRGLAIMLAAALAAFLIHFILLYAKLTHFYTLVFGFSLFALSLSLVLEQLYFKRNISKWQTTAVILLVLLNPAIHYHVIFYFIFAFFVLVHTGFNVFYNRAFAKFYIKRNLLYFGVVTVLSLVPYLAFILIAGGSGTASVSVNIPVNYWMIYHSSLHLISLFSLDTAAQIDMFRYGDYIKPWPRIGSMVVVFLIGSLFIMKQWKQLHIGKRVFVVSLFGALLLSIWMAMGYSESGWLSFHNVVGTITLYLTDQANALAQLAGQAIAMFVNVLRFPHRFQFIFFYLAGVLFMIALFWLHNSIRQKRGALLAILAAIAVGLLPLFAAKDYFLVLTSGDFATFLKPYNIPADLKAIKSNLAQQNNDKLFILPTLESGRDVFADDHRHGFIDKFLIYYLDQPTLYHGTGGEPTHKAIAYSVYRAIEDGQPWWDDLLVYNLGITHVLQPKQATERPIGFSYMPGIGEAIAERLAESSLFTKTYDGADFALYETAARPANSHTFVDLQWDEFTRYISEDQTFDNLYVPLQTQAFIANTDNTFLRSDNLERSFYNLYTAQRPQYTFYPNMVQLTFSRDLIASSTYTVNVLSFSTLNDQDDPYNTIGERMPSLLGTHSAQFIGVAAGNKGLSAEVKAPADGTYRVLLHAASQTDKLIGAIDNRGTVFNKITGDQGRHNDFIDMTYFYADVTLRQGSNTVMLHNPGDQALVVESLTIMPQVDIPADFTQTIDQAGIQIIPIQSNQYQVTLREGS